MSLRRRIGLALPFLVGPIVLRLLVPRMARRIAAVILAVAPRPPAGDPAPPPAEMGAELGGLDEPDADDQLKNDGRIAVLAGPFRMRVQVPDAGMDAGPPPPPIDAPAKGTITIPASMVALALDKKDIRASNAIGPDGKPWGARVHNVSRYVAGLVNGDVIVYVEGTRTDSTNALVEAAFKAVAKGAKTLRGRIVRGDDAFDVVLEIPQDLPAPPPSR